MALAAGVLSQISVSSNSDQLQSAVATGGTAPYTYQWYRSTTAGFSPGAGSLIAGAVALLLSDSGLIPNSAYYYLVVVTDSVAATATSSQLTVNTTATQLSQNQFSMAPIAGMVDLRYDYNTKSAQIDVSQVGTLYSGAAVKLVDSAGGVPKVIGCTASSDEVFGFINFDIKTVGFVAGNNCEISQGGNVMYLYATGPISRGKQVTLDLSAGSGNAVAQLVTSSGADLVGYAYDKAAAAGALIRVELRVPSFTKA